MDEEEAAAVVVVAIVGDHHWHLQVPQLHPPVFSSLLLHSFLDYWSALPPVPRYLVPSARLGFESPPSAFGVLPPV